MRLSIMGSGALKTHQPFPGPQIVIRTFQWMRSTRCLVERFRLHFQQRLTQYLVAQGSVAKGFGVVWEKTLEEVPLDDNAQGQLYRELIDWAGSDKLFTALGKTRLEEVSR